jgi:uncharacterized membrane protein
MKLYVSERRIKPFSMYLVTIGSILILISLIAGISMLLALVRGIPIHTFNDVNTSVIRFAFNFIIPLLGGILLVVAGITMQRLFDESTVARSTKKRKIRSVNEKSRIINNFLSADEKAMVSILKNSKSPILQSDLMALSGYSKVKVHRILKKLEVKGVIKRSRFGITNRVFLNSAP